MLNGIGYNNYNDYYSNLGINTNENIDKKANGMTPEGECRTCAERKYQDGSNEMVSFKSAAHIAPNAAASAVRAHEGEHVSNAYKKAAMNGGEVVNASVAIHTSTCPECGRTYVSGGTTTTMIKYNSDKYAQNTKSLDRANLIGQKVDIRQ